METECSETSAYKIQTPGNYPEENIQQNIICYNTLCGAEYSIRHKFSDLLWKLKLG